MGRSSSNSLLKSCILCQKHQNVHPLLGVHELYIPNRAIIQGMVANIVHPLRKCWKKSIKVGVCLSLISMIIQYMITL